MTGTGIRFIESNPASAEFDRQTDIRRQEQQRQLENERADQDREDEMTRTALTALASGDMTTFEHYGRRTGLADQLPEEAIRDGRTRQLIGMGGLIADRMYGAEDQQALFVQEYLRNGGDEAAAAAAVGSPRRPGSGPVRPNEGVIETVMRNGREVKVLVDQVTGQIRGEIGEAPPRGAGTVSDRTLNQNQLATLRLEAAEQVRASDTGAWLRMTPEQRTAAIEEQMQYLISPIGGGGAAPAGGGGGQQFAYEAQGPNGDTIFSNDGQTWFTADGRRVQ